MKKFLGFMMAIAVVGVILGGCSSEENTDNTMDNTTAPADGGGNGANGNL
jgi:hypothetical protein